MELSLKYLSCQLEAFKRLYRQVTANLGSCDLCLQQTQTNALLCDECYQDLPFISYQLLNQNLLNWPAINSLFPTRCFDSLVVITPYQWPINFWLKQLKFQNRFEIARLLANLVYQRNQIIETISRNSTLTIVPTHVTRWQQRGYNQAHLIAKHVSLMVGCQYLPEIVIRKRQQTSQVGLSGRQRRRTMVNDFTISQDSILPEHIVLFDDVITTGATVNTISKLLKKYGAKTVTVLTLSIALPN